MSQAPGLVAGYWIRVGEDQGISLVLFDSEQAARGMADQVVAPPSGVTTTDSVEVGEVVAQV